MNMKKMVYVGAITAVVAVNLFPRDDQHHQVVLNASHQPHLPHGDDTPVKPTTRVEWGVSGTSTSAALSTTTSWYQPFSECYDTLKQLLVLFLVTQIVPYTPRVANLQQEP